MPGGTFLGTSGVFVEADDLDDLDHSDDLDDLDDSDDLDICRTGDQRWRENHIENVHDGAVIVGTNIQGNFQRAKDKVLTMCKV